MVLSRQILAKRTLNAVEVADKKPERSLAIFPQGATNVDQRCNAGERRVFNQLKRCLGDDFLVWHNVPIGAKARQPDFVIVSPQWGLLLLEVKDWKRGTMIAANHDSVELEIESGHVTSPNPLRQARDYTFELAALMQHDSSLIHGDGPHKGKLLFPYGWGAVFSKLKYEDVENSAFQEVFPSHRVLMRDDLSEQVPADVFLEKLLAMFTVRYPCTLTLPQSDRIRWHLFPEIRMNTQTSLDLEPAEAGMQIPDLMQVMDLQQEQIARTLGDGHRVIHGVAGSGKTMILIFRAEQLAAAARPDNPVLVLCFNRELAGRIKAALRSRGVDERVQVRTFHSWCDDLVRTYHLQVPAGLKGSDRFVELAKAVERAVIETRQVPSGQYLALLVDEAHDFDESWLRIASRMVDPGTNSLLVLYDDAQSIYQKSHRKFNFSRVDINAVGRTHILKLNYRNTAEILTLAMHCAQGLLEARGETDEEPPLVAPTTAGRRGPIPVLLQARSGREEAQLVSERIAEAIASGTPAEEIAVLCPARYMMEPIQSALIKRGVAVQSMGEERHWRLDWSRSTVKLITMHSAKGLEFPNVFVSGLQAMPMREDTIEDATRLLYVAMTRATHELTLSACGDSAIVQRIKASIERVRDAIH